MLRILSLILLCLVPSFAWAQDIAVCKGFSGYVYYAPKGGTEEKDSGWEKIENPDYKLALNINKDGEIDFLVSNILGVISYISDGYKIEIVSISDDSLTIIVKSPASGLIETYAFQNLNNGKSQVMKTYIHSETSTPGVISEIANCSYVNIDALKTQNKETHK